VAASLRRVLSSGEQLEQQLAPRSHRARSGTGIDEGDQQAQEPSEGAHGGQLADLDASRGEYGVQWPERRSGR
jgi:hypothetical protein